MIHLKTLLVAVLVFAGSTVTLAADKADESQWLTNYDQALSAAKASRKLVLADFTGSDWCGYCIKLKKEVLDTPEFKADAANGVVLLELDFPRNKPQSEEIKKQNHELRTKFKVSGFPTVVLLDATGKELGRIVGYGGKDKWLAQLKAIVEKSRK